MSDWSWDYMPDADVVVGGLSPGLRAQVEELAVRLADAASVKYMGDPPIEESGVSRLQVYTEGRWMVWFQEHQRLRTVFIASVQHWPLDG